MRERRREKEKTDEGREGWRWEERAVKHFRAPPFQSNEAWQENIPPQHLIKMG